jgi:predicted nucleic acid-binding protein
MDRRDPDHTRCARLLSTSVEPRVVPSPVLVEVEWLATSRLGPTAIDALLADIEGGGYRIANLTMADYGRVRELCRTYADLPLGFVDASVIAVTERLGERRIATLDHRHFRIVRARHVDELELLPD